MGAYLLDNRTVQRFLRDADGYTGEIDGNFGTKSWASIPKVLANSDLTKTKFSQWPANRQRIAVEQLIMMHAGADVGTIDGFIGPQTRFALEQYHNLLRDITPPEPDILHQTPIWPRQKDVPAYYGEVGVNQKMLQLPYEMKLAWDPRTKIQRISVHEKVHDSAARAFTKIAECYSKTELSHLRLDLFGGSLNVRKMRGGNSWSMHSWGIAIDFDPEHNQLHWGRDKASLDAPDYVPFWQAWEAEGWISLGRERNYDWMHVQAARL